MHVNCKSAFCASARPYLVLIVGACNPTLLKEIWACFGAQARLVVVISSSNMTERIEVEVQPVETQTPA